MESSSTSVCRLVVKISNDSFWSGIGSKGAESRNLTLFGEPFDLLDFGLGYFFEPWGLFLPGDIMSSVMTSSWMPSPVEITLFIIARASLEFTEAL